MWTRLALMMGTGGAGTYAYASYAAEAASSKRNVTHELIDDSPAASLNLRKRALDNFRAAARSYRNKKDNQGTFDVLVIGGGATGAGVALDAATRGLKVALIERDDFASGTSSKSTKLVHGGVRYLEKAVFDQDVDQLKLVFEALKERKTFLENARHLASSIFIQLPCYDWKDVPMYWAGLKLYDIVAGMQGLTWSRFVFPEEAMRDFPTLRRVQPDSGASLKGVVTYCDGQFDDARVNVSLALTAAMAGASVLNHAEVEGLIIETLEKGGAPVCKGAKVYDKISGRRFDVRAKRVVNAAGPFADGVRKLANRNSTPMIRPSAGTHITLPGYYASNVGTGMIVPKTRDGRVVFLIPWLGAAVAGTTDADSPLTDAPQASGSDVEFILDALRDNLSIDVRREDVLSTWCGLRPLAGAPADEHGRVKDSASTSRDHIVNVGEAGIVTIAGGKWTTYRKMAEDVVDCVAGTLKVPDTENSTGPYLPKLLTKHGCVTTHLSLVGSSGYHPALHVGLAQSGVSEGVARHLSRSYGDRARAVLAVAHERRGRLNVPLVKNHPILAAEVAYACRYEMCATPEDFLARRTRLAFLDVKAAREALPKVVEVMGREHHWGSWRKSREIRRCSKFLNTFEAKK